VEKLSEAHARLQPTRVRHQVVTLVVFLGMITYLDRACISTLAPAITEEFSLSKIQMGYVFSAFALAYAAFEIPSAWLADRQGTRVVLTRIVIWWSTFTMATGATVGYASLLLVRFLFGMGEAGAWPCMGRTFSRWIPRADRGRIQGVFFAAAHFAGGMTPFLVAGLMRVMPWRAIFIGFGAIGLLWAFFWYRWFRDDPAAHPAVNAAELTLILRGRELRDSPEPVAVRFRALLWNRNIFAIAVMYFPNSFVFYFCITWLPTYLRESHGLADQTLVFFSGLPLVLSVLGDLSGGLVTDKMTKRFGARIGRCGVGGVSYLIAALALFLVTRTTNGVLAGSLIAAATAITMFSLPAAWSICIDLGGENSAMVSAAMNTAGQIGSLLCPLVVAYSLQWYGGNWNVSLAIMASLFLIGTVAWCLIHPPGSLPSDGSVLAPG
jgi:MFS transporter, ACS family, glucarate transporter